MGFQYHTNTVELIDTYGGDLTHAMSAWTSTSRDLTDEKRGRIDKLLQMLAAEGHETPFEKSAIHVLVNTEIATHIHLLKHRIGTSVNAESARYKELKDDKYYIPTDWPVALQDRLRNHTIESIRQYHGVLHELEDHYLTVYNAEPYNLPYTAAKKRARKRAKESARFFLPYANQLAADVMFNFRSLINFLRLRFSDHAQREVAVVARQIRDLVEATGDFTESLKAFGFHSSQDVEKNRTHVG